MPNFAKSLKQEIARISRKENKASVVALNRKLAELKRALISLRKTVKSLACGIELVKKSAISAAPKVPAELVSKSRLGGKAIARLRKKLGLSRKVFGKLVGASQPTVYLWESGRSNPKKEMKTKLVQLRNTGKREVKKMVKALGMPARKPRTARKTG